MIPRPYNSQHPCRTGESMSPPAGCSTTFSGALMIFWWCCVKPLKQWHGTIQALSLKEQVFSNLMDGGYRNHHYVWWSSHVWSILLMSAMVKCVHISSNCNGYEPLPCSLHHGEFGWWGMVRPRNRSWRKCAQWSILEGSQGTKENMFHWNQQIWLG